jgi:PTS system glucitol/sorbitol-specific IIA component
MRAVIKAIGSQALSEAEKIIILFGETATDTLKEYSVIQDFEQKEPIQLTAGDKIKIDEQSYTITQVGAFANENLNSISHCTLVFDAVPKDDSIMNGIYLTPYELPKIKKGSVIEYLTKGV